MELFNKFNEKSTIRAVILGGQYCGKATMLARMHRAFNDICRHMGKTDIRNVATSHDSIINLHVAEDGINTLPEEKKLQKEFILPNSITKARIIETYEFELFSQGKEHIAIEFVEIPEKYWKNDPEIVIEVIRKAQAIIVAIDTPSLCEGNDCYCQQNSNIDAITHIITAAICNNKSNIGDFSHKLILFVPLKCEKEIISDNGEVNIKGMEMVCRKVKERYLELISRMRYEGLRDRITMAILPISTIKEIEWCRFAKNEEKAFEEYPRSYFRFRPNLLKKVTKEGTTSEFCEQPLVYILVHALEYAKLWHKEKYKPWIQYIIASKNTPMERWVHSLIDNEPLLEMITWLKKNRMKRSCGFEILQNPLRL